MSLRRLAPAVAGLCCLLGAGRVVAAPCNTLPTMLIVEDRSGSMNNDPSGGTCPTSQSNCTKWQIASNTVPGVLAQYTNQFDYALMMYPSNPTADACSTGTTTDASPASPGSIQTRYQNTSPGGATPTAPTLDAARTYMGTLGLPVAPSPKFTGQKNGVVLLITDGLPNCNGSLDRTTCTCTPSTHGCSQTGGTAYNCLDDSRTITAAANLKAAGYLVYVVGFGADTAGNSKVVLDNIAAAGGTTSSYTATDQSSLQAAINTISGIASTCCQNACNPGDGQCAGAGNGQQTCQLGSNGCYGYVTTACASGEFCQNGACHSCNSTCTAGAQQCGFFGDLETCVADANGCTDWEFSTFCSYGSECTSNACIACNTTCNSGQTRCVGNQIQTCNADSDGCTSWGGSQNCGYGSICNPNTNACNACNTVCVAGTQQCTSSSTTQTCVADGLGCTAWVQGACNTGETCSGGTCNPCQACTAGQTRCSGSTIQSCVGDSQGCSGWQDSQACASTEICVAGACVDCSAACTVGATQCSGNNVQQCVPQAGACNAWQDTQACSGPDQICSQAACCTNACTLGATRCNASGQVETCQGSATGCTVWVASGCPGGELCYSGACLTTCQSAGEITGCPTGFTCSRQAVGDVCVPSGGTIGGTGTSVGTNGTSATNGTNGTSATTATTGTSATTGTNGTSAANGSNGSHGSSGTSVTSASNTTSATSGTSATHGSAGSTGTSASHGSTGSHGTGGTAGSSASNGSSATGGSNGSGGTGTNSDSAGVSGSTGTVKHGSGAGGCSCDTGGTVDLSMLGLGLLALVRRRR